MARTPRNRAPSSSRQQQEHVEAEREEAQKTLLESYIILTSELKTRLLKSQDEKDNLIQTHAQELSDARESWERLQLRLERSHQKIRTLTKERDELKEGFEVLLQKVEVCNNFSSWPFPRIHLSSVLSEPAPTIPTTTTIPTPGFDTATLISRLTQERDEARLERDLVMRESAAKFSMLEAQLALREAELLSLQNENELNRPVRSSRSTEHSQPQLSSDDAIRILQYNAAKNRTIQMDIKKMRKRLETVREKPSETGPSSSPLSPPRTPTQPQSTAVLEDFNAEIQDLALKLDALQLERARLSRMIAEEEAAVSAASEIAAPNSLESQSDHGQEICENCARLRGENAKLQERISELQQTPSSATRSVPPPSPPLPQSPPPHYPPLPQSPPPHSQSTPPNLLQSPLLSSEVRSTELNGEGELSMELATPFPSTVVLPPSSSPSSSHISSTSSPRSHPTTRWDSPPPSALLSPFVASTVVVDIMHPAAVELLIDLDDEESIDPPLRSRSPESEPHIDNDLIHPQFRLSELELAHETEDNDVTVRPTPTPPPHLQPPSPPSPPRTPGQVLQELDTEPEDAQREIQMGEDVIDELRDMILELMPDLGPSS